MAKAVCRQPESCCIRPQIRVRKSHANFQVVPCGLRGDPCAPHPRLSAQTTTPLKPPPARRWRNRCAHWTCNRRPRMRRRPPPRRRPNRPSRPSSRRPRRRRQIRRRWKPIKQPRPRQRRNQRTQRMCRRPSRHRWQSLPSGATVPQPTNPPAATAPAMTPAPGVAPAQTTAPATSSASSSGNSLFGPVPPPSGGIPAGAMPEESTPSSTTSAAPTAVQTPAPAAVQSLPMEPSRNNNSAAIPGPQLGLKPIVAPPLPISADQQAQLQALLEKYDAGTITPVQYQAERAKILNQTH